MLYIGKACVQGCGGCIEGCGKVVGKSCSCCADNCGNACKCCGEGLGIAMRNACETCDCCFEYASAPFTCCSLCMAVLYLIPGIVWLVFAILSWVKVGDTCSMRHTQEAMLVVQAIFYLLGAGFLIYSVGRIGAAYNKAFDKNEEAKGRGEQVSQMEMTKQVFNFIGYDWIFLIYSCVFCISFAYDIAVIIVGALDTTACFARIGNITSGSIHIFLRLLLCCMFCCITCQIQCSENFLCKPFMQCISCGFVNPDKRREMRARRAELRAARQNSPGWMSQQPAKQDPMAAPVPG